MKKYILFVLIGLLVCQSAFAARVKYNTVTGEIISMAFTKDNKVGPNEALLDVKEEVKANIEDYKVDENAVFRAKTKAEKDADKAAKDQVKADRKARKTAIMTKLGINKQELKGLLELIQDGSDD